MLQGWGNTKSEIKKACDLMVSLYGSLASTE